MGLSVLEMLLDGKSDASRIMEYTTFYNLTKNKLTYHSGVLDGLRLSESQVGFIGESGGGVELYTNEPVTLDDIRETNNHFACFDYMLEHVTEPVTEEMLRQYHIIMKKDTYSASRENPGNFKVRKNMVGQLVTTEPKKVSEELTKLLEEYNSKDDIYVEDIFFFHRDLIKISPFPDCNGRIARMIMFKECLWLGITPVIIEDIEKSYYHRALKEGRKDIDICFGLCLQAQKRYDTMVALYHKKK
ncbi:MAG: cell filamentation protein Fic [Clostridiales bacterium]|nr:cell filamentation protein Fic [Clostridiales bacterium]